MSTSVASVVSHFPDAENGFTTTTAGSVGSGAGTVTLNSVAGYTNGQPVVLVIDPTDASKKQTFTGIVDTAGVQITSVVWTAGTNQTHALGATVVDYATATHIAMISKGIQVEHEQDGTHGVELVTSRTEDTNPDPDADFLLTYDTSASALKKVKPSNLSGGLSGWTSNVLPSVSSVTNNGNRSADITFASTVASYLTPGMRLRTSRTVAAPTGAITLNGTNQSASKTGTITGLSTGTTWTFKIKAKLNSYKNQIFAALDDGSTNILQFYANSSGQIVIGGGTYASQDTVTSYQSHPLGKWFEVTASITIGTPTGEITMDGAVIPSSVGASAATTFTSSSTTLYVGRNSAGNYIDGKLSQFELFNAVITASTLRGQSSQTVSGSETNALVAYKLDQASGLNDLTSNANNLTANNTPTYSVESPFTTDANGTPGGTYDYAIVTKVATTVATVQTCEGNAIATSGGISSVDLSSVKSPFGMPTDDARWDVVSAHYANPTATTIASPNVYNSINSQVTVPVGSWVLGYEGVFQGIAATSLTYAGVLLAPATPTNTDRKQELYSIMYNASNPTNIVQTLNKKASVAVSSATAYLIYAEVITSTGATTMGLRGDLGSVVLKAKFAYL